MFRLLRVLGRADWAGAASMVSSSAEHEAWTPEHFERALRPFLAQHTSIRLDPSARAPNRTRVTKTGRGTWEVEQVICDAESDDDWVIHCWVDLEASTRAGKPI